MMKYEFESLAGRNVTDEQYKAIETLYMSSNLEKVEFVKSIRTMLKSIPQPEKKKDIKRMAVRDRSGYRKTPNGCYYHIEFKKQEEAIQLFNQVHYDFLCEWVEKGSDCTE
nr:hypothetical protein [uncultured Blautia sp.]